jgi:hypothetical protein
MGRRSRKRAGAAGGGRGALSSRAERDAARRQRAKALSGAAPGGHPRAALARPGRAARPPAPWGRFPLGELVVLIGIVLIVWGFIVWGDQGRTMVGVGFALAALAGLELSIREHFAGFRSHTTLLSAAATFAAVVATVLIVGSGPSTRAAVLVVGGLVFTGCFWALRQVFRRRSGGLSFR